MKQPAVHISEVKSFLRCRLAWYWSAPKPRGFNLEPIAERPALHFGRLVHEALQVGYDSVTPYADAFRDLAAAANTSLPGSSMYEEERQKQTELGARMLAGYQDWATYEDKVHNTRFLSMETKWEDVRIGRIKFAGRFDAVIERDDGLWILDFKTTSKAATDWVSQDIQATAYVHAARQLIDPKVRGLIFRFLLKKAPHDYNKLILKKGGVTQRANLPNITTHKDYTFALAVATLKEMVESGALELPVGDTLDDYAALLRDDLGHQQWYEQFHESFTLARRMYWDQLQTLRGASHFFWDVPVYRTDEQVARCIKYVLHPAAKEMVSKRKGRWIGPTGLGAAFAVCRNCSFSEPCELVMTGADHRSILQSQYRKRDRGEYG